MKVCVLSHDSKILEEVCEIMKEHLMKRFLLSNHTKTLMKERKVQQPVPVAASGLNLCLDLSKN